MASGQFDFIIVGGGSAGSALGNRLSATATNRVLVLEVEIDWCDRASLTQLLSTVLHRTPQERDPHGHNPHGHDPHGHDNEAGHGYGRSAARG